MNQPGAGKDLGFLIQKSGIAFTVKAGGMAAQYLFVYTLARLAGPAQLGLFTLAYTLLQLLVILALLGLDNLLTRQIATANTTGDLQGRTASYRIALRTSLLAAVALSLLLFSTADWLAVAVFNKPDLTDSLRIISLSLPFFTSMVLHAAAFRGDKNMFGFTFYRTVIPLLNTLVVLTAHFLQVKLLPVAGFTMAVIITSFGYRYVWKKNNHTTAPVITEQHHYRSMLAESLPMLMTGSIFFILNWIDNLFIGYFKTEAEVGIYDTAFKLATIGAILLQAVNAIQGPVFAEFKASGDLRQLRRSVFESNRLLFLLTLPLTALLLAIPEWLLGLFGAEFKAGAQCLIILAIGHLLSALCGSVGMLLQMTGHQRTYNKIIVVAAGLSILLNILLIPGWGIMGAAIASSAARIFQNITSAIAVYKKLSIFPIYIPWFTHTMLKRTNKHT